MEKHSNKRNIIYCIATFSVLISIFATLFYTLSKPIRNIQSINSCIDQIHNTDPDARILVYDSNHDNVNPVITAIFNYDYIIVSDEKYIPDSNLVLTDIHPTTGNKSDSFYRVFKNPDAEFISGAYIVPQEIINWDADPYSPYTALNRFSTEITGTKDIFEEAKDSTNILPNPEDKTNPDSMLLTFSFEEPGDYYTSLAHTIHLGDATIENTLTDDSSSDRQDLFCCEKFVYNCPVAKFQTELINRESVRFNQIEYNNFLNNLKDISADVLLTYSSDSLSLNLVNLQDYLENDIYVLLPHSIFSDYSDGYGFFGCEYNFKEETTRDSFYNISEKDIFGTPATIIHIRKSPDGYFPSELTLSYTIGSTLKSIFVFIIFLIIASILIFIKRKSIVKLIPTGIKTTVSDNRIYIFSILIGAFFWLILSLITHSVPFGNASAVISDGYIEDYPTTAHFIQKVKAFEFYKFDYTLGFLGEGFSLSSLIYFLNPLRLILLLFPYSQSLLAFNTFYAVEFILIGSSMIFYLTNRPYGNVMKKTELKLIPISLAYSLSSYVVCYYSFGGFLDIMLILPLIMLAMDRLIYKKKYLFYILILAYYMILSPYFAFLLCEFLFMYFFVLEHKNYKTFFKNGIRFAISSIAAAILASFSLIPFYHSVMNSGYVENDQNAGNIINILSQNLLGSLQDLEVMHRTSLVSADVSIANTYCGLLLVLILPLFIFVKNISLSSRIRRLALIFFLYFSYGNELMNYILHGFHLQSLVPNRFSLFFIFMMINVLYDTLQAHKEIFNTKTLLIFSVYSGIILLLMIQNHDSIQGCMSSALFVAAYIIIIALGTMNKKYSVAVKILLLFLIAELSLSTINSFRSFGKPEESEMISSEQAEVIREFSKEYNLKENGLLRSSIINSNNFNSSCITDINSISCFSSTLSKEQIELAKAFNIRCENNNIIYGCGNPLADLFLNNKYYFEIKTSIYDIPSYFEKLEEKRRVIMYQNHYVNHYGISFSPDTANIISSMSPKEYSDCFDYQNAITNTLINESLYIKPSHSPSLEITNISYNNEVSLRISIPDECKGDIFLSYNGYIQFLTNTNNSKYNSIVDTVIFVNNEDCRLPITEENLANDVQIACLNIDTVDNLNTYIETISDVKIIGNPSNISIDTENSNNKSVYIPVPTNISLNNKSATMQKALGGFIVYSDENRYILTFK